MAKKPEDQIEYISLIRDENGLNEMIYDPDLGTSTFIRLEGDKIEGQTLFMVDGIKHFPFNSRDSLVKKRVVLFPSDATEYGDDKSLLNDIKSFVHKYLEVGNFFESIIPFYVMLTWCYDSFNEVPYLRAIGDYGSGKSRFLKVVGSICYKPIFTVGATTTAPIFRMIDKFKGTLILDEADLRFSDTNVEMIKILNNGFQKGMPVVRCGTKQKNYEPDAFDVFSPKLIATRNQFDDKALESRFIVEHMDGNLTRKDIPTNLDAEFDEEALGLRNKLLMWRLRNDKKIIQRKDLKIQGIDARLNQIIVPLASIIRDEEVLNELIKYIRGYQKEIIVERSFSFEGGILETLISIVEDFMYSHEDITMQKLANKFNETLSAYEKPINARKMGSIMRNKFGLTGKRTSSGYVLDMHSYKENIERLCKKYGLDDADTTCTEMNKVNVENEAEDHKNPAKNEELPF